ncbi:hypothethical protein (plasmid) [Ralstonia solanacearum CMR15]|nr:hypothethical protein [Ralstonia solanacearum CMR15]
MGALRQTDALLTEAADRVQNATSSVLFAVMATDGGGAMVDTLEHVVPYKAGLLSLGVIDKAGGVSAFAPRRGGTCRRRPSRSPT